MSIVVGPASYKHAATVHASGSGEAGSEAAMRRARRFMASAFMPAPVSNIAQALIYAGNEPGGSVAAIWGSGAEVIRDPYSASAAGQVSLDWLTFWDLKAPFRTGAYKRVAYRLA